MTFTDQSIARPLIIALIAVAGCAQQQNADGGDEANPSSPTVNVKIARVEHRDVETTIEATGKTDALRREKLYAPIAGTVTELNIADGHAVKAGTTLAVIRTREAQSQLNGAYAMLAAATTPEAKAEAERMVRLAQAADNSARVVAPINGIITGRSVNTGEIVADGAEMFSIVDPSTIVFIADVPLTAVGVVRTGMRCRVRLQAMPDKTIDAVIDAISPQSDVGSQTMQVRLRLVESHGAVSSMLKTGMAGEASIITGIGRNALVVPRSAVLRDDATNTYSVVTIGKDSLARIVGVTIGSAQDSTIEVRSDQLSEGMTVIIEGNYALADSTRVNVVQ